jgi:hypothetical protein
MVNTFEGLLGGLARDGIRFTLVGGLAVSLNGFIRTTEDMDILVDDESANLDRLLRSLRDFGQGYATELTLADFVDEEGAIRIREAFDLDIFVRMRGLKYRDLLPYVRIHTMNNGMEIPYLGIEGLVLLKGSSSREKDQIDVAALRAMDGTVRESVTKNFSLDSLFTTQPPGTEPDSPLH